MISILSKIFIKNENNADESRIRSAYGTLCCVLGILLNVVLFGIKYFAGVISGSIAITADAFNNLPMQDLLLLLLRVSAFRRKSPTKTILSVTAEWNICQALRFLLLSFLLVLNFSEALLIRLSLRKRLKQALFQL